MYFDMLKTACESGRYTQIKLRQKLENHWSNKLCNFNLYEYPQSLKNLNTSYICTKLLNNI